MSSHIKQGKFAGIVYIISPARRAEARQEAYSLIDAGRKWNGVIMRYAIALLLLASTLLLAGCLGSEPAKPANASVGDEIAVPAQYQEPPALPPEIPQAPSPVAPPAAGNATKPEYVNYCYPTYWKGTLVGTGHNDFDYNRCGEYNYSMEINVVFTVPFDLAEYLAGKDFNFKDCPGLPAGAANGSRDISIDGSFQSAREITSLVENTVDRRPDMQTSSSGAMYISWPYGLAFATYPRQDAQAVSSGAKIYPHLVVDRCTWEGGFQVRGFDEAVVFGAESGGFADSENMRTIVGKWAMDGNVVGNYTLERTN